MALPNSRNTTYNGEEPILAADLNDLQDQIVNLYSGKRGDRTVVITPAAGVFVNCAFSDTNARVDASAGPWNAQIPLPVFHGERIKSVTISRFGTGSGSMSLTIRKVTTGNTRTNAGTNTVSNPAGSWLDLAVTGLTETVASGTEYYLYIDGTTTGQRFNNIRLVTDVP